jgi:hypothetical protein
MSGTGCPECGAYLLAHPSKLEWLKCPCCGFCRPTLNAKPETKKEKNKNTF